VFGSAPTPSSVFRSGSEHCNVCGGVGMVGLLAQDGTPYRLLMQLSTRYTIWSQCHDAQQLGVDAILANHRGLRVAVVPARIDSSSVASTSRSSEAWLR
jgi:hypothetical protein